MQAEGLGDDGLGALLRRRGLHEVHLRRWREQMLCALGSPAAQPPANRAQRRRIRALEREVVRKDKALAETAALLVLGKKAAALCEDVGAAI